MMICLLSTMQAPVWTKEKDDKLPPVLRRKKAKKEVGFMFDLESEFLSFRSGHGVDASEDLHGGAEEEQMSVATSQCSTSKVC